MNTETTDDKHIVLLIDDSQMVGVAIGVMLEEMSDIELHHCLDPREAINMVHNLKPTVILLDMVMPEIDGLSLLKMFHSDEQIKKIPVVALSGLDEADLKADIFAAGGHDYLIKLPEETELLARIRYHSHSYLRMCERDEAYIALAASQKQVLEHAKKLSASRKEIDNLVNSVDGVLWKFKVATGQFSYISTQIKDMLGVEPSKLINTDTGFMPYVHPDDMIRVNEAMAELQSQGGDRTLEFRMLRSDHRTIWVRNIVSSVTENGTLKNNSGLILDISESKKMAAEKEAMENRMRQSQKLESIGQLAAGVAHEINTPSQFLNANTHFLKESFEDIATLLKQLTPLFADDKTKSLPAIAALKQTADDIDVEFLLDEIPTCIAQNLNGIKQISTIVAAMKDFSKVGSGSKDLSDLNQIIENTVTVSVNEWRSISEMEMALGEIPQVSLYPGEFKQVLLNLIVNAAYAIRVKHEPQNSKGVIRIKTFMKDDSHVAIEIADSGCGIAAENIDKIFDPFFTTKEVGQGTGQGLSVAYQVVVDQHRGKLDVKSKEGTGSVFTITLPIS